MTDERLDPIEDLVGDLFVDRHDELRMCREWVEKIPRWHLNSFAFVGRRRTGKTAILVRFFNELFHTQDRVIPVFISFARYLERDKIITNYDFADEYFTGYLRSYLAFRHRKPLLFEDDADFEHLRSFARQAGSGQIHSEAYRRRGYQEVSEPDRSGDLGEGVCRRHPLVFQQKGLHRGCGEMSAGVGRPLQHAWAVQCPGQTGRVFWAAGIGGITGNQRRYAKGADDMGEGFADIR